MALKREKWLFTGFWNYDNDKPMPMDLTLDMNQLNLSDLNNMFSEYFKDSTGNLEGRILLEGIFEKPVSNGNLGFEDAGLKLSACKIFLDSVLKLLQLKQRY